MKAVKLLALMATLWMSFSVQAQCPVQETTVEYINGIDTKRKDAEASKERIKQELVRRGFTDECVQYETAYNSNEPLFLDFLEAGMQRAEEETGRLEAFWESYLRERIPFPSFQGLVDTMFEGTTFAIQAGEYVLGDQLAEHLVQYQAQLGAGRHLILVGHSQGNLYANEALPRLTAQEQGNTDVVAVATPSDNVAGQSGPYTTLHRDTLATTLFAAIGALPSNTPMTRECADTIVGVVPVPWLCHGFKEAYMLGTEPRTKIVNNIASLLPSENETAIVQGRTFRILLDGSATVPEGYTPVFLVKETTQDIFDTIAQTTSDANGFYMLNAPACRRCAISAQKIGAEPGTDSHGSTRLFEIVPRETYNVDVTMVTFIPSGG